MTIKPRAVVAVVLAFSVLVFIILGSARGYFGLQMVDSENAAVWADLIKVIIGGLIGFMAGEER